MLCAPLDWQYAEFPRQLVMQSCALCVYVRCGSSNQIKKRKKKKKKPIPSSPNIFGDYKKQHHTNFVLGNNRSHTRAYVNGSKSCNLCLTEKFHMITSKLKLLNKRSELVSTCHHANKYPLKNYLITF